MPRTAVIQSVLFETDSPEIVLARDVIGTSYLAVLVSRDDHGDRFLCVPVSEMRLADFTRGRMDLRTALTRPESGERFFASFDLREGAPTLMLEPLSEVPEKWLPQAGFLLTEFVPHEPDGDDLISQAIQSNLTMGVLSFDPPEARARPRIFADRFAEGVRLFQNFVRHACRKALSGMDSVERQLLGPEPYVISLRPEIVHGSFRIGFESQWEADLGRSTGLGAALTKVDELTQHIGNPSRALEVVQSNRGHVVGAYQALLEFVASNGAALEYAWADPGSSTARSRRIGPADAERLFDVLSARKELSKEEVEFTGVFTHGNTESGKWTLMTIPERKKISGGPSPEAIGIRGGVSLKSMVYHIRCEERMEQVAGTGKQKMVLELTDMVPLQGRPGPILTDDDVREPS